MPAHTESVGMVSMSEVERLRFYLSEIEAWATTRPAPRREKLRQIRALLDAEKETRP